MAEPTDQGAQLHAARKEVFQQKAITNWFKTVLLIVALVGLIVSAAFYFLHQTAPTRQISPNDKEALRRVIALERELQLLQLELAPARPPNRFLEAGQSVASFLISNWVLLSFVVAILTAIYVKLKFQVDYFESYRDIATKKNLSRFYEKLGDRLMVNSEWEAAESAYRNALEINPTNLDASYGVAKASLFQPLKGQKFYAPEIVDAKLDYLIANRPTNKTNEAQLYFLKGMNRSLQSDESAAEGFFLKATAIDPAYAGAQLLLGYLYQGRGDLENGIARFKRALEIDPSYVLANNNLGFSYLLDFQFDAAIRCLELADRIAPSLVSLVNLGNAYCYAKDFSRAQSCHLAAAEDLAISGIAEERYMGGVWSHNFMPLHPGDHETIKRCVKVYTFEQKKALTLCGLALDQALLGSSATASATFAECLTLEQSNEYREFFLNRLQALVNHLKPARPILDWFEEKISEVQRNLTPNEQRTAVPAQ